MPSPQTTSDAASDASAVEVAFERPARHGERWTTVEFEQLIQGLRDGLHVLDLAAAHQRSAGAIRAAAVRLLGDESVASIDAVDVLRERLADPSYDPGPAIAEAIRAAQARRQAAQEVGPLEDEVVRYLRDRARIEGRLVAAVRTARRDGMEPELIAALLDRCAPAPQMRALDQDPHDHLTPQEWAQAAELMERVSADVGAESELAARLADAATAARQLAGQDVDEAR